MPKPREVLIAAALITLITVLFFSIVRAGNTLGIDEWMHLYRALQGSPEMSSRPLAIVLIWAFAPIFQANVGAWHALSLTIWAMCGVLVYLIVRLLAPERPAFALMCGMLYIVYFQDDFWLPLLFLQTVDTLTVALVTLIALWAHFAADVGVRHALPLRVISVVFAFLAPLVREASIPVLIGVPVMVFVVQRRFDRARWIGLAAMCGAVVIASMRYVLALIGIGGSTYGAGLFVDLDPVRMGSAALIQYRFTLDPLIERASVRPVLVLVGVIALLMAGGLWLISRISPTDDAGTVRQSLARHAVWIGGSILVIFLGFSTYLPTIYADSLWRTHMLSRPAEAVLFASIIWLISDVIPLVGARLGSPPRWASRVSPLRWVVRGAGAIYVAAAGTAMLYTQQQALDRIGGTWAEFSEFMTTLADDAPDVRSGTLFVYMETPDPHEAPFTHGFGFQYAMRYFYSDRATGIIPSDNILGTWEATDAGIRLTEDWVEGSHVYGWDAVIFIGRDADGDVYILDALPEAFAGLDRDGAYDPHSRVVAGEMATRIRATFGIGE